MAKGRLAVLVLSETERFELKSLAARRNTAQALALRARIVLSCAEGKQNKQVAAHLRVDETIAVTNAWRGGTCPCDRIEMRVSARDVTKKKPRRGIGGASVNIHRVGC